MPLSNAERQKQWRDKRNNLARAFTDTPAKFAEIIMTELGVEHARKIARAIDKRVRAIKRRQPPPGGLLGERYSRRPPH